MANLRRPCYNALKPSGQLLIIQTYRVLVYIYKRFYRTLEISEKKSVVFSQVTHFKHALLHFLVDFIGRFRSFPIFQQRFRCYQAVKKYLLSQHYVSVLATAEAITQTKCFEAKM